MGSTLLRNIVLALALVIFSFVVGIVAADSAQEAAVWLFAVIGILVFIAAGKKIWMGIFLVTPFCAFMPSVAGFSSAQLLIVAIFFYWLILAMLGHVKLEWKKLISLDILVFLFVAYMAISFCRNPVSVGILRDFGVETDNVGGREYFQTIIAVLVYLAISMIPFSKSNFSNVLRWGLVLKLICTLIVSLTSSLFGTDSMVLSSESFAEIHTHTFFYLANLITVMIYGVIPVGSLFFSGRYFVLLLLSFAGVLITGKRTALVAYFFTILGCGIIKREFLVLFICGMLSYGCIWYMSERGIVRDMPYSAQRVLTMCPGVEVQQFIKVGAEDSSEWRKIMWRWALDPRTGLIKDYIWGDGPVRSYAFIQRHNRAVSRGEAWGADLKFFAATKQWHGGFITNLSMLGMVGSVIMLGVQLRSAYLALRVCRAIRDTKYYIYSLVDLIGLFSGIFVYYISTGVIESFLASFLNVALLKMYYNIALDEGRLQTWRWRKRYVPIMVKAQGRVA